MYMYIAWENALRPELNQVINQKWDHKIRNILIKRAGIRYIALPCPTLRKWKPGGLQHVFISILNRVGFYQAILLTIPLVITAHLNSFPAGCFLLCWRPRVGPWVGCKKERDACSDMKDLHTKAWKGTGGSDIWELIQAQPCGSANTSIPGVLVWINVLKYGLCPRTYLWYELNFWDFADGWFDVGISLNTGSTVVCSMYIIKSILHLRI